MTYEEDRAQIVETLGRLLEGQADLKTSLTSEFGSFASHVDELESAQAQLRVDLMDRLDRQQDTLTMIRDDMLVNLGGAESAHTANANTRVEVRKLHEMVFAMQRQISNLQTVVRELQGRP